MPIRSGPCPAQRRAEFYLELEEKLRVLPGVNGVGMVNALPMDWSDFVTRLTDDSRACALEGEMPIMRTRTVSDLPSAYSRSRYGAATTSTAATESTARLWSL